MISTGRRLGKAPISALANNCSLSDRSKFRTVSQPCCTLISEHPWVFFILCMFKMQHWYKTSEARS